MKKLSTVLAMMLLSFLMVPLVSSPIKAESWGTPTQLTFNTAGDHFPSISGDGSKIAFYSDVDGDREIFVVNSDGSGLLQLTSNTASDQFPSISGDGSKIAFYSNVDGDYEIFVINSDGTGLLQLTSNTAWDGHPSISGDGSKIAFFSNVDGDHEIFVVMEGAPPVAIFTYSPETPLVNQPVTFNASASADPDGYIADYFWDFGDATSGTGMIINHTYTAIGNYTVTLTVMDNDNLTDTATDGITVTGVMETMVFFNINPNPTSPGQTITLKGVLIDETTSGLGNENIELYVRPIAGTWRYITSLTTNIHGIFTWQATIPAHATGTFIFAVYYPGSETYESTYNFATLTVQ